MHAGVLLGGRLEAKTTSVLGDRKNYFAYISKSTIEYPHVITIVEITRNDPKTV